MLPSMGKDLIFFLEVLTLLQMPAVSLFVLCMIFCCPVNAEEFLHGAKVLPELPTPQTFFGENSQFVPGKNLPSGIC